MLLFNRILNFKKAGGLADKRGAKRHPVGLKFPLKAKITLMGRDGEGNILPKDLESTMDWGGQLVNLSGTGLSLRLHPAAVASKGEDCGIKLELDNKLFELDGTIAHFVSNQQYVTCGILLKFPDSYTQKAYLQLLEPVIIGSSLQPVTGVKQDAVGFHKEQYEGEDETVLTVWRDGTSQAVAHFELVMHDYHVRGSAQNPELQAGYRDGAKVGSKTSRPAQPVKLNAGHQAEVIQLFHLVVPNVTRAVPADVRGFLQRFTA